MTLTPLSQSAPLRSLGASVEQVRLGWRQATEACTGTQSVRALLTFGSSDHSIFIFSWKEGRIQRFVSADTHQPANRSELEMIDACIQYGFILIYRLLETHEEPVILHQQGILVPLLRAGAGPGADTPHTSLQGDVAERQRGDLALPEQTFSALPVPALYEKEFPSPLSVSQAKGWHQGEQGATAIFLYILLPISGGISGYLLTGNSLLGWASGILLSGLLLGIRIARHSARRRGRQVVSLRTHEQKAA